MNKKAMAIQVGRELVNQKTARAVLRARYDMNKEALEDASLRKMAAAYEELTFRQVLENLSKKGPVTYS